MRIHAIILAVCVYTRAHTIPARDTKLDALDNVELDDVDTLVVEPQTIVKENNLRTPIEDIPVKVIDENSNDYIPTDDNSVSVKRIEVDLRNPGPPQRQEHETQNPENYGDRDKIVYAIKHTIENAENVFNEGLKSVSNSFKTFFTADEDLPSIQKNIENLKLSFSDQIDKLNNTIRTYLKPESVASEGSEINRNVELVESRLKFLDNNFKTGIDTLSEGLEVYSIIKEEDEAEKIEKSVELKADVKADPPSAGSDAANPPAGNPSGQPTNPTPAPPASIFPNIPWAQYLSNVQNSVSSAFNNLNVAISNTFNGGNQQNPTSPNSNNPIVNFFQGINLAGIIPGQNTGTTTPGQQQPNPPNVQADTAAPPPTPAPWGPQAIIQQVQNSWNNLINPGQNQQAQQNPPQSTNPIQQAFQNIVAIIRPPTPPAQQPANTASTPDKKPETPVHDVVVDLPVQPANAVPAPVNEQPQEAQPAQVVAASAPAQPAPAPAQPASVPVQTAQAGPIQQLVQNNPIIKGIQSAVQRIQGTPNPETPREEPILDEKEKENVDPKGHYGGNNHNAINQGHNNNSDRVEDKVEEEKAQIIPSDENEVAEPEDQIKAEELKTPSVSDKTE